MKQAYTRPALIAYGRIDQLTRGSSGSKPDYDYVDGQLITDNNPTCETNGPPACLNIVS